METKTCAKRMPEREKEKEREMPGFNPICSFSIAFLIPPIIIRLRRGRRE